MDGKKVKFDSLVPDAPSERGIVLFGKDLSQIPCFRNSFLYGISIGIGVGFLAFMKNLPATAVIAHRIWNVFRYHVVLLVPCRYKWTKDTKEAELLQQMMQQQAMYEGTEKERQLDLKAESA